MSLDEPVIVLVEEALDGVASACLVDVEGRRLTRKLLESWDRLIDSRFDILSDIRRTLVYYL